MAGHVAPEAAHRGPIATLQDGDIVTFDIQNRTLSTSDRRESRLATGRNENLASRPG